MTGERMLIVDDEPSICVSIQHNLKKKGFQVETALSGEEAIDRLETECDYDLVITDLMMGEKSGVDVLNTVQKLNMMCP